MKKYRIDFEYRNSGSLVIDAESPEEAERIFVEKENDDILVEGNINHANDADIDMTDIYEDTEG